VIHIHMPPLRERKDDIPLLVEHFLAKFRHAPNSIPTSITEEALAKLVAYEWPGNVRELENAIERAVVLSRGNPITLEHLPFGDRREARDRARLSDRRSRLEDEADAELAGYEGAGANGNGASGTLRDRVAALEKQLIVDALERAGGDQAAAAEQLGLAKRTFATKLKEHGLD
jgi:DNA-binding NtrC family response regulator